MIGRILIVGVFVFIVYCIYVTALESEQKKEKDPLDDSKKSEFQYKESEFQHKNTYTAEEEEEFRRFEEEFKEWIRWKQEKEEKEKKEEEERQRQQRNARTNAREKQQMDELNRAIAFFKLKQDFTVMDVKKAYRALMKKYHPDNENGNGEIAEKVNHYRDLLMLFLKSKKNYNTY